ncbi:hypothetical protein [Agrobacterium cavarae]
MDLNTREIATLVWLSIIIAVLLIIPKTRQALCELPRAFAQQKILQILAVFAVYVVGMIWGLHAIGIWDWDQLKNTIIWTFSVALIAVLGSHKIADDPGFFRKWITQNFQILAFVQFLITLYTYPLWIELLAIPIFTLLTGIIVVGGHDPKTKRTASVLPNIAAILTVAFFGPAFVMTVADFWHYATIQTWRDFYVPIILTLLFVPFIFVLYVAMSYETAFVNLHHSIKDTKLRRSAQLRALLAFGTNIDALRRWQRHVGRHRPQSKDDIKNGIQEIKAALRRERTKLPVDAALGWSPALAKDFLRDFGLPTRDYFRAFGTEWHASSSMIEIGRAIVANNIAYYVEGTETAVTKLKLKLNINEPSTADRAEARFRELSVTLVQAATGQFIPGLDAEDVDLQIGLHRIRVVKCGWPAGTSGGYDKILTVSI